MASVRPQDKQPEAVADVRRDQMLAAAAHLIAERGFSDTRIADVAKRVGASPALVIYYFGTKDSLLTEALRWSEKSFYAAVEDMLHATPELRRRLESLLEMCLPEFIEGGGADDAGAGGASAVAELLGDLEGGTIGYEPVPLVQQPIPGTYFTTMIPDAASLPT